MEVAEACPSNWAWIAYNGVKYATKHPMPHVWVLVTNGWIGRFFCQHCLTVREAKY